MHSGKGLGSVLLALIFSAGLMAQGIDVAKMDETLGRSGTKLGDVYKVGFPRTDLHVTLDGVVLRPGLALGSWAAFASIEHDAVVMGDLVLLQSEVNPVLAKLRESRFEITALHNHLLNESPHVMYMHYMGRGDAIGLAKSLKSALALTKTPPGKSGPTAKGDRPAFVNQVEEILGRKGNLGGGVLAFGFPRADTVRAGGMALPPAMGVAEAINFQDAGMGRVATTGDFVLTSEEVNPVISTLEDHHILITALHNHMLDDEPRLFFMHFWGLGPTQSVAEGIKAALEKVHAQ